MNLHEAHDPLRDPISQALEGLEPELERFLIGDALIERQGRHYRILSGGESWDELELLSRHRTRPPLATR